MRKLDGMRISRPENRSVDHGKPLGGERSGSMRFPGTALLAAIAAAMSALSPVRAAAPVPSGGGGVAANVPWLLLVGLVLAAAAMLALWQPALRRLIAGAAVFVVGAVVAWSVLLMGAVSTMDTDRDVPSWAIAGAALILTIGAAAAARIALTGRSKAG